MEFKSQGRTERAFKLIELIVVLAVIVVLAGLILPPLALAKYKSKRVQCTNNLKLIGLGLRIFASDHSNAYPAQVPMGLGGAQQFVSAGEVFRHFLAISNTLTTPKVLLCPADTRKSVSRFGDLKDGNISYFISLDAKVEEPQMLLSGDRNLTLDGAAANSGLLVLWTNSGIGFTRSQLHNGSGNATLGDGSVQPFTSAALQRQVTDSGALTNRLLIP
jgi:type II secretory pathway pseudopilin PulG